MSKAFKLPDLGEGIHEAEVIAVPVKTGDSIREGDPILEVETDKAAVEIPSPFTGLISDVKVQTGDVVKVGDVLLTFEEHKEKSEPGEKAQERTATPEATKPATEKPPERSPAPEALKTAEAAPAVSRQTPETVEKAEAPGPSEKAAAPQPKKEPVPASPSTRRLARELGIDLHAVMPSGPAGLVTTNDVRTHAARSEKAAPPVPETAPAEIEPEAIAPSAETEIETIPSTVLPETEGRPISVDLPPLPDFTKWGPIERIAVRPVRRSTAARMALSWSRIPHVHNQDAVDITVLETFRRKHKTGIEAAGGNLTLLPFVLKALTAALKAFPDFNASLDMARGEIIRKHYCHIGVAVDTEDGLLVPVIRDVDRKSITELSIELKTMARKARARKTPLEEMQGATFTVTNAGPMGGGHFAPIINYPQAAILGMGMARMQAVANERGKITARRMLPLVLCFDHRIADGADAIRFMGMIMRALEDPEELLLTII